MTQVASVGTGWSFQPQVMVLVVGTGGLYLYGLRLARLRRPGFRWSSRRTGSFVGGITALIVALGSPVEEYAHRLLSVHMVQHLVLMQVAPPLLLLGRPVTLLLAASPSTVRAR